MKDAQSNQNKYTHYEISQEEVLRDSHQELSMQMSPTNEQRSHSEKEIKIESENYFKCNYCAEVLSRGKTLEQHMIRKHKLPDNCKSC